MTESIIKMNTSRSKYLLLNTNESTLIIGTYKTKVDAAKAYIKYKNIDIEELVNHIKEDEDVMDQKKYKFEKDKVIDDVIDYIIDCDFEDSHENFSLIFQIIDLNEGYFDPDAYSGWIRPSDIDHIYSDTYFEVDFKKIPKER